MCESINPGGLVQSLCVQSVSSGVCHADVDALTKPRYDLKLGFPVAGKVLKVMVEEGDTVAADQPLIELDDREGETVIELYKLRSKIALVIRNLHRNVTFGKYNHRLRITPEEV